MLKLNIRINEKEIRNDVDREVARQMAPQIEALLAALRSATPIDTGAARSGWTASRKGRVYSVENSVDYVKFLNAGTSQQAPANFIERVVLSFGKARGTTITYR